MNCIDIQASLNNGKPRSNDALGLRIARSIEETQYKDYKVENNVLPYRKNLLERVGVKVASFVQPQRSTEELIRLDIAAGPEFRRIAEDDHLIKVTGGDGTIPLIERFQDCKFNETILLNLSRKSIFQPTLIQKCVIPIILNKQRYDLMARAQTGTGKTAAFAVPILQQILYYKRNKIIPESGGGPFALIIAPTRELTQQLGDMIQIYANDLLLKIHSSYGATSIQKSKKILQTGCDILVSSLGRATQFSRDGDLNFEYLKFFILDEADKLLQFQSLSEINDLKTALDKKNSSYRTFMFSATFDSVIQEMVSKMLTPNYFYVSVGQENSISETIQQNFIQARPDYKIDMLFKILMNSCKGEFKDNNNLVWKRVEKTIIFCNTCRKTNWLALQLSLKHIKAISINGDRTQQQRLEAKNMFECGECDVLVSTNVTARGLNIKDVMHIINFELPMEFEDYVHRIGRTGRAGNFGRATSFVDNNVASCCLARCLVHHLELSKQPVPEFLKHMAGTSD